MNLILCVCGITGARYSGLKAVYMIGADYINNYYVNQHVSRSAAVRKFYITSRPWAYVAYSWVMIMGAAFFHTSAIFYHDF